MATDPILINTRPTHRSDAIRAMRGVAVVDLPLLEINDLPIDTCDAEKLRAWQAGNYHALIITSVESAKRALAYLAHLNGKKTHTKPDTPMIAVGDATAKCLINAGFTPILPDTANNEGMLKLPQIRSLGTGSRVLIWRGVGGRKLLHDTLNARGVQIDVIRWYERVCPADLPADYAQILPILNSQADTPIYVLVSSQMAFEHWQSLPNSAELLARCRYLTLGERLYSIVKDSKQHATLIDDLHPNTIHSAISRP
ncbi:uroporphyrinogen-III synthase [Moraxella nasibovis]|uniref:uroporphyrinogen-III synthase n=1 Tax=Moraxella nasibovis TaxID=2904120 RepID=UPI00240EF5CF|nr:uroporphyrinogen-III synthase [Moraxella nasibovis]WFF38622.1 uroporphyrinogen-III synthase [Moraxella nasibovis]